MRYRDSGDYENLGVTVDDNLVLYSIILAVILDIGFFALNVIGW